MMPTMQATWRRPPYEVAREFRVWLRDAGLTQEDVAAELGVSQSQVSRVLRGQFGRRSEVAEGLAAIAGVSLVSRERPGPADPSTLLAALQDRLSLTAVTPDVSKALERTLEAWTDARRRTTDSWPTGGRPSNRHR
jgi:transcriptional regulator with XRE-family HTH domain